MTDRPSSFDPTRALTAAVLPAVVVLLSAMVLQVLGDAAGSYPTKILMDCGIAIIAAVSLTIVNGFTGQFSIGHAAFVTLGGYSAGLLTYYFCLGHMDPAGIREVEPSWVGPYQWLLLAGCLAGGLVAAAAGWLVGLPSLRLRGDYLAIVTLGFGEIVRVLLQQTGKQLGSTAELQERGIAGVLLPPAVGGSLGLLDLPRVTNVFWVFLFVGATLLIAYRLKRSSYGRALLSIREDEIAAESMGVDVPRLKVRAFVLAAFLAGVAGALYAHQQGQNLTPRDAGFVRSFEVVIMVVLGGLGSISGSVLAAILITILNEWLRPLAQWRVIIFAAVLIAVMIFRPRGLLGLNEIWELFPGRARRR